MTPDKDKPINNLEELFASNLPWDIISYGLVAQTVENRPNDKNLQKFWTEKKIATYSDYIFKRVSFFLLYS